VVQVKVKHFVFILYTDHEMLSAADPVSVCTALAAKKCQLHVKLLCLSWSVSADRTSV